MMAGDCCHLVKYNSSGIFVGFLLMKLKVKEIVYVKKCECFQGNNEMEFISLKMFLR